MKRIKRGILFLSLFLFANTVKGCGNSEDESQDFSGINQVGLSRSKRQASLSDRENCGPGDSRPKIRVDSSRRVETLRREMRRRDVDAFLVPSGDSHQSEYIAPADKRIKWVSGFSGSSGFAVVTLNEAALWTDGRYFLQAEDQLDCDWLFMRGQEGGDSGWIKWLSRVLPSGSKVGADPTLVGAFTWLEWEKALEKHDLRLTSLLRNPIDDAWDDEGGRPQRPTEPLEIRDIKHSGKTWEEKIEELRFKLEEMEKDAMIVTGLDEVAWLFNMRGSDIPYSPVFRGYAIVDKFNVILYISPEKQTEEVYRVSKMSFKVLR